MANRMKTITSSCRLVGAAEVKTAEVQTALVGAAGAAAPVPTFLTTFLTTVAATAATTATNNGDMVVAREPSNCYSRFVGTVL